MFAVLNKFLKVVPPILLAGAIIFLALTTIAQTTRLSKALKELSIHEVNAANAIAANVQQTQTIVELDLANKTCVARWKKAEQNSAASVRALADFKTRVELESKLATPNPEDLQNESCQTLLFADVAVACPALASGLLDREALYYED